MFQNLKNGAFISLQHLLPQHTLSTIMHWLTRCEVVWWKNLIIKRVIDYFDVNMNEAEIPDPSAYPTFNRFFTRSLKAGCRPLCPAAGTIISPADGAISQIGAIKLGNLLQAKGKHFGVAALLGGDHGLAAAFADGAFVTIYLSPRDYHRLHMPCDGTLTRMIHVPGKLFSVNEVTAASVENLFARNERVVALFDTPCGKMALVLVGAIFVSSIETVWHGEVTPPRSPSIRSWDYTDNPVELKRGEEMGRFNMGSTVIALFGKNRIEWLLSRSAGYPVQMGQHLGNIL